MRRFFYAPKQTVNKTDHEYRSYSLNPACLKLFQISEYFEKSKFEFSRFLAVYAFHKPSPAKYFCP